MLSDEHNRKSYMKEDIQYLYASLSKIRFNLVAFYVSLDPQEKQKVNFVIPELTPPLNCLAMVNKSFSHPQSPILHIMTKICESNRYYQSKLGTRY